MHTLVSMLALGSLLVGGTAALHPLIGHRAPTSDGGYDASCKGGLCAGMAHYPVGTGIKYYAEFNVPGLPEKVDGITDFIYFNIFFGDSKPLGRMNQFVPQLMVGNPLCDSSGPPLYKPIWHHYDTWVFGSQYFFETFNVTANKTEGHAATGELQHVKEGEIVYTSFELDDKWVWTLTMGVKGDDQRVSKVVAEKPYMGILPESETKSWSESTYDHCFMNSCWELYGMRDRAHYPATGSKYDMRVTVEKAGEFKWFTNWKEDESPTCPGAPKSNITESHTDLQQDVIWDIYFPKEE